MKQKKEILKADSSLNKKKLKMRSLLLKEWLFLTLSIKYQLKSNLQKQKLKMFSNIRYLKTKISWKSLLKIQQIRQIWRNIRMFLIKFQLKSKKSFEIIKDKI